MKKRIVIINQSLSNHGDEAAHKALVRMLAYSHPAAEISVILHVGPGIRPSDYTLFRPEELHEINYILIPADAWVYRIAKFMWWVPLFMIDFLSTLLSRSLREIRCFIRAADLIVSAPGGVDLGPYKNWHHLFLLILSLRAGKPTAIYSISFGPLPDETWKDRRFSSLAKHVLRKVQFLSLRDDKSQEYARGIQVDYYPSADTAYLDVTKCPIPPELAGSLLKPYAVFVPDDLFRWHPSFRELSKEIFDKLYRRILSTLVDEGLRVVILQHLFGSQNNEEFYREFSQSGSGSVVMVIPNHYSCEVQQAIIQGAAIVVGTRYHTVVFAIKNCVPFLALTYEHKASKMLSIANLQDLMFDLNEIEKFDLVAVCDKVSFVMQNRESIRDRVLKGHAVLLSLAQRSSEKFTKRFPL
jgi:colanic acid/amylovoran biosynthesis protein